MTAMRPEWNMVNTLRVIEQADDTREPVQPVSVAVLALLPLLAIMFGVAYFQLGVGAAEGSALSHGKVDLPASTQWTTAADSKNLAYYYHTA